MTTIASLKDSLVKLNATVEALEASAGLQASAEETEILRRNLARNGVTLRATNGGNKSVTVLFEEISKLAIPPGRRIELKRSIERLAAGATA